MSSQQSISTSVSNKSNEDGLTRRLSLAPDVAEAFLDEMISRLWTAPIESKDSNTETSSLAVVDIRPEEVRLICQLAVDSFARQKTLLRIESAHLPIAIVGDLHGQFRDLRSLMTRCGLPPQQAYLFLGDYVDRGLQGVETVLLLLAMKVRHPDRVYMLRGNHEDHNTAQTYGFYDEVMSRFAGLQQQSVWLSFVTAFNMLPLAALVGERIMCMHGGISPHIDSLETIENLRRPSIIPPYGLMCDLLWADPDNKYHGWALSARGISFTFDDAVVDAFCDRFGVDLIVRAHQITSDMFRNGYKFNSTGRLLTLFSAPNYQNMLNDGAVLRVGRDLTCRFMVLRARRRKGAREAREQERRERTMEVPGL